MSELCDNERNTQKEFEKLSGFTQAQEKVCDENERNKEKMMRT